MTPSTRPPWRGSRRRRTARHTHGGLPRRLSSGSLPQAADRPYWSVPIWVVRLGLACKAFLDRPLRKVHPDKFVSAQFQATLFIRRSLRANHVLRFPTPSPVGTPHWDASSPLDFSAVPKSATYTVASIILCLHSAPIKLESFFFDQITKHLIFVLFSVFICSAHPIFYVLNISQLQRLLSRIKMARWICSAMIIVLLTKSLVAQSCDPSLCDANNPPNGYFCSMDPLIGCGLFCCDPSVCDNETPPLLMKRTTPKPLLVLEAHTTTEKLLAPKPLQTSSRPTSARPSVLIQLNASTANSISIQVRASEPSQASST